MNGWKLTGLGITGYLTNRAKWLVERWYFVGPALVVIGGVLIPLGYLVLRAFEADPGTLLDLLVRWENLILLGKTLALAIGVLVVTTLISLPLAWITARADLPGRWILTVLGVLPLAIPGYVMAYVLLAMTGEYGTLSTFLGISLPRFDGYDGALFALSLTTFPYLFLNLRTSFLGMDPKLVESARTLGSGPIEIFFTIIVPQLRPGFLSGSLLIVLHVFGDFGVVSLMRFETFSYALYLQYMTSYDRIYAAWLALFLVLLTGVVLVFEAFLLRDFMFHSDQTRQSNEPQLYNIGLWSLPAYGFSGLIGLVSVGLPVITVGYWMGGFRPGMIEWIDLLETLWNSILLSVPSAVLAAILAVPIAFLGVRYDSFWTKGIERTAYLGYATPRLAFALAWIVFVLAVIPFGYQTIGLVVVAYSLHFLAEAIGPIRSSFYQIPPSIGEAARSLGSRPLEVFFRIVLPLLKNGLLVGMAFVFLSVMKELPMALLLSPPGVQTLATTTWGFAEEAMFDMAAPYALMIMLFSACFVGLLLRRE